MTSTAAHRRCWPGVGRACGRPGSPDGRRLAFWWLKDGRQSLAVQAADGTTPLQVLLERGPSPSSWTPDGRHLAAVQGRRHRGRVARRREGERPPAVRDTPHRTLARVLTGRPVAGVRVRRVRAGWKCTSGHTPDLEPEEQVSIDGGSSPAWNPNGREVFFVSPADAAGRRSMMAVDIATTPVLQIGRPKPLFDFDSSTLVLACEPLRCYDVAPDGQRFFATRRLPAPLRAARHAHQPHPELVRGAEGEGAGGRGEVGGRLRPDPADADC